MAIPMQKRRRADDHAARPKKKFKPIKKQKNYHSSSEDEGDDDEVNNNPRQIASDAPRPKYTMKQKVPIRNAESLKAPKPKSILKQSQPDVEAAELGSDEDEDEDEIMDELERNTALNVVADYGSDEELEVENDEPGLDSISGSDGDEVVSESEASEVSSQASRTKRKRNDPDAFATSISKILDTKLTTSKRQDPLLSRSRSAAEAAKTIADTKLEDKAKAQMRSEKKQAKERGRIRDVLGLQTPDVDTGAIMEEENRLKKTAQRGVVKLFNAVRAAQVKAEEAMRQAKSEGMIGMQKREEKVNEMSKQGFLDLISSGGKKSASVAA